jgi:thiol-disulfide isomerase/thioredoxin
LTVPTTNGSNSGGKGLVTLILIGIAIVLVVRAVRPNAAALAIPLPPLEVAGWLNTDEPLTTGALRGRVVLVDCWASWCGPCVEKMPQLVKFYERYRGQGLEVVGLTPESSDELRVVRAYVESVRGLDWPIGYGARIPLDVMGISVLPTFVLYDKSGKSVWSGHDFYGLEDAVIAALAEEG